MGFVSLEFIRMVEPENIEKFKSDCELRPDVKYMLGFEKLERK